MKNVLCLFVICFSFLACKEASETSKSTIADEKVGINLPAVFSDYNWNNKVNSSLDSLLHKYTPFTLNADLSHLSDNQKKLISKLIDAGEIIEELFWYEAIGDKEEFLAGITDPSLRAFARINYGPYDRLDGNKSFIDGYDKKPLGANFYPADMSKEEYESSAIEDKRDLYSFVRRDDNGELVSIPYHQKFKKEVKQISDILFECSQLAEDPGFKLYLYHRSKAMLDDYYRVSDMAWLEMKSNMMGL